MNILFKTNIDNYKTNCFPTNLTTPPRIGDSVLVTEVFIDFFSKKNLPLRLEVVDVIWTEKGVVCELWYKKIDVEMAKVNGTNLF